MRPQVEVMNLSTATLQQAGAQRTAEALGLLGTMLSRRSGRPCRIRAVDHRPSAARSSFALEDIEVLLESGDLLRLVLKALGAEGLNASANLRKPLFLHDPLREIEFYQHVLSARPDLGTATLHSSVMEPGRGRFWLLLERVPGRGLRDITDFDCWRAVARWLVRLHAELTPLAADPHAPGIARILRYDANFLRMWLTRAHAFVLQDPVLPLHLRHGMDWLVQRYDRVVDRLTALPQAVIHGEFYASNILVRETPGSRVCPVDWEMVALGPALIDLAALVAGQRHEERRRELALTYRAALPPSDGCGADPQEFLDSLAYCRLHLAVQWLGWSPDPPLAAGQARSWLGEALSLAEALDL